MFLPHVAFFANSVGRVKDCRETIVILRSSVQICLKGFFPYIFVMHAVIDFFIVYEGLVTWPLYTMLNSLLKGRTKTPSCSFIRASSATPRWPVTARSRCRHLVDKLPFAQTSLGMRFKARLACRDTPFNHLDAIAKQHNQDFEDAMTLQDKWKADRKMIQAIDKLPRKKTWTEAIVRQTMQAKLCFKM